jgi:hypothetical protein
VIIKTNLYPFIHLNKAIHSFLIASCKFFFKKGMLPIYFLFFSLTLHAQLESESFKMIKKLHEIVTDQQIMNEIESFKEISKVNIYPLFQLEDDGNLFPLLFNLYFLVRVDSIEPYIILKYQLSLYGGTPATGAFGVKVSIELSPQLSHKKEKIDSIVQLMNDVLKHGIDNFKEEDFKQNFIEALHLLRNEFDQSLDKFAELPRYLKESLNELENKLKSETNTLKINKEQKQQSTTEKLNEIFTSEQKIPLMDGSGESGGVVKINTGPSKRPLTEDEIQLIKKNPKTALSYQLVAELKEINIAYINASQRLETLLQIINNPTKIENIVRDLITFERKQLIPLLEMAINKDEEAIKQYLMNYITENILSKP